MILQILVPNKIFFKDKVKRITAEGLSGSFGILPNHIDFVEPLTIGILSLIKDDDSEVFVAVNEGILVKQGEAVMISTPEAVMSQKLSALKDTVESDFLILNERERETKSAMARLESDFIRRFIEQ